MNRKPTEPRGARRWPRLVLVGAATTVMGVVGSAGATAADAPTTAAPTTTSTSLDESAAVLPETGSGTGLELAVALTAFSAGTALVVVARRRRQPSQDA